MSGVWAILQATVGQTSQGTWVRCTVVSAKVWHSTDTTIISQRDHVETEGDCAAVKTVGEGSDVSQGAREGTTAWSTEEEDGEEESVGKQRNQKVLITQWPLRSVIQQTRKLLLRKNYLNTSLLQNHVRPGHEDV